MNRLMYEHPLTAEHLKIIREAIRYHVVGPIGKTLATWRCGWVDFPMTSFRLRIWAMTEWGDVVRIVAGNRHLVRKSQGSVHPPEDQAAIDM
jgi:phosphopantothenoylcysteine decarboxylase